MPQKKKTHTTKANSAQNKSFENFVPRIKRQQLSQNEISDIDRTAEGEKFVASGSSLKSVSSLPNAKYNSQITKGADNESSLLKPSLHHRHKQFQSSKESGRNQNISLPSSPFFPQNGHLASFTQNGLLQSGVCAPEHILEKLASLKDNGVSLKPSHSNILFKYFAETLLYLYFGLSWTFVTSLRRLDIPLKSEGSNGIFLSVEEGLVYKVIWCFIFACVTDFISWKASFRAQAFIWVILLCSLWCPSSCSIIKLLATVCAASSPLLVSQVGIAKIWGDNCLEALSRLALVARLYPVFVHLCTNEMSSPFGKIIEETLPPGCWLTIFNYSSFLLTEYVKTLPAFMLILGCALCLFQTPSLVKDVSAGAHLSIPPSTSPKSGSKLRTFRYFVQAILLKTLVYVPSSLWLAFGNSSDEERTRTMLYMVFLCLVTHGFVVPILGRFGSPRTALLLCSVGLCVVYSVSLVLYEEGRDEGALSTTLTLYVISCIFQTYIESFVISKMRERIGTVLATLLSLHLVIQFQAQSVLNLKPFSDSFTPSRAACLFGAALDTLGKRFLTALVWPFVFFSREEGSFSDSARPVESYRPTSLTSFCTTEESKGDSFNPDGGERCGYMTSFSANILASLPEVDLTKETTFLARLGIVASILALLLILCHRWH